MPLPGQLKITSSEVETLTEIELGKRLVDILKHGTPEALAESVEELLVHADPPKALAVHMFIFHNGGNHILHQRGELYNLRIKRAFEPMLARVGKIFDERRADKEAESREDTEPSITWARTRREKSPE